MYTCRFGAYSTHHTFVIVASAVVVIHSVAFSSGLVLVVVVSIHILVGGQGIDFLEGGLRIQHNFFVPTTQMHTEHTPAPVTGLPASHWWTV